MDYTLNPANILCGLATSNGGTIITVPAGRIWSGTVTVSATVVVASGGGAVNGSARVSTFGSGVIPPAGDYVRVDVSAPASILAAIGTVGSGSISAPLVVAAPADNSVSLILNSTNTTTQSASASGSLIYNS